MGDKPLDLRDQWPPDEEIYANGWRLGVTLELRSMPYAEYLKTFHWQAIRERTWRLQKGICHRTGCGHWIHDVHHNSYANLGDEPPEDVEGLCRKHHQEFHEHWRLAVHLEGRKQFLK